MKPAITTIVVGLVLSLFSSVEAKSWRGIVPLQTTRAAVVQILGEGAESAIAVTKYHFEHEDVSIQYSNVHFGLAENACQLPADLVLSITVYPKVEISLESLGLKRESLKILQPRDSEGTVIASFDEDDGLVLSIDGRHQQVVYLPTKAERARCAGFYGDLSAFVIRPIHFMCPPVTVACPEETEAGKEISFIVTVSVGTPVPEFTYNWTTDRGTIAFGQGTSRIKVDSTGLEGKTITATVEVNGIDPSCPSTASCSVKITKGPHS